MMEQPMMHGMNYGKMSATDKMYQAKDDVRTLVEAGEIKKDKARYKAAMASAKEQAEALKYIAMNPGKMGEMSYSAYAKGRKNGMGGGMKDHYA